MCPAATATVFWRAKSLEANPPKVRTEKPLAISAGMGGVGSAFFFEGRKGFRAPVFENLVYRFIFTIILNFNRANPEQLRRRGLRVA